MACDALLVVVAAVALFSVPVSAQQNVVEIPQKILSGFTNAIFPNSDLNAGYKKVGNEFLQDFVSRHGVEGLNADIGMWDWLMEQTRQQAENKVVKRLAETPLENISQQCYDDVTKFFSDVENMQIYALKMQSSWGDKTPWYKALSTGNAKSMGAYELCTGLTKDGDGLPFDIQFCYMLGQASNIVPIPAVIGGCFPASCSAQDLETAHKTYLGPVEGAGITYDCFEDIPWSGGAIATLSLLSFFALLVLIGSIYHVVAHDKITSRLKERKTAKSKSVHEQTVHDENEKETEIESDKSPSYEDTNGNEQQMNGALSGSQSNHYGSTKLMIDEEDNNMNDKLALADELLMSLSLFHNTEKIFDSEPPPSMLGSLNGIRVLSMFWIILGHSWQFPYGHRFENPAYVLSQIDNTANYAYSRFGYAVDSFFVLSAFLVTYLTLKELKKNNGRKNWGLFYFHRFWRITPLYMMNLAILATLPIYMGVGAGKEEFMMRENENCQKYWWTNLLYFNNLYPFPGNLNDQCLRHSWYLANDMQFFFISPVIIYCMFRSSKLGVGLIAFLSGVSFGSTAYVSWYWGMPAYGSSSIPWYNNRTETTPGVDKGSDLLYCKPWIRIQVYLVGMMLGFIFHKMNGKQYKLNKFVNILCWAVSAALACSAIYGLAASGPETKQWVSIVYNCFHRLTFAVGVAWVIFACITGNGGYINSFLSWNVWNPLAKLNFAAYLIHPVLIYWVIMTKKSLIHFTYVEMSYWFISNLVASYAIAYILSVLVEFPTVGIQKVLVARLSRDENRKSK